MPSPQRDLAGYLQAVNAFPMLSETEEMSLARRYHEEDDLDAAWKLVTSHLRFVVKLSRRFSGYGLPEEDLIQEGNIGLMKAVKKFDPDRGVRLAGVRGALDQSRNPRIRFAQLAAGQGRHHQGAA